VARRHNALQPRSYHPALVRAWQPFTFIYQRRVYTLRYLTQAKDRQNVWISSCWTIPERDAQQLIGGWIYLHPKAKTEASQFGSVLPSFEPCERREGAVRDETSPSPSRRRKIWSI
jgi:hypothetical protein